MTKPKPRRKLDPAGRRRRDRKIINAYIAGERRSDIAKRYGVSPRMVSRIVAKAGATMSRERMCELNRARMAHPGCSGGRPREIHLDGEDMRFYGYLRQTMGAAYARQTFGIAAR